ncbi:MAG: hypothetical protein KJN93_07835 [Alphaproteobacteria bacterium]|nr:hypothetical protein [Alphaproteobacteria bacterium]
MTEDQAIRLIRKGRPKKVLAAFAKLDPARRRALAKVALPLVKDWHAAEMTFGTEKRVPGHADAYRIALLATGTLSEIARYSFQAIPRDIPVEAVIGALCPDWTDRWVAHLIEKSPFSIQRLSPLWKSGLCARPDNEAFILGYYVHRRDNTGLRSDTDFLKRDVWRFFEIEGGGEFSLAAHDKYSAANAQWSGILLQLCAEGLLDRGRLLDASLDALERDFGQFRAGWYSRFHTALAPDPDEAGARADRYAALLASTVRPTVSFALKAIKALEKDRRINADALLGYLPPALQAPQKSAVTGALQLLASAARREPSVRFAAARLAAGALISEASDVQSRALDLVEKLGATEDAEVQETLAAHIGAVAPSLEPRLRAMTGRSDAAPAAEVPAAMIGAAAKLTEPITDPDAGLAALLAVLEDPRDPFAVERAMDAVARCGAAARASPDRLSPLAKRAQQILGRDPDSEVLKAIALTGVAWSQGVPVADLLKSGAPLPTGRMIPDTRFAHVLLRRSAEIIQQVLDGHALPMLSAPSDTSGAVAPLDLAHRLADYRKVGCAPGLADMVLALLRLGTEDRDAARAELAGNTEAERAAAYALGGDIACDGDSDLWAAAWAARDRDTEAATITALLGKTVPDAGVPARHRLVVWKDGKDPYYWCRVRIETMPPPVPLTQHITTAKFHQPLLNTYFDISPCGSVYPDIAWASLVWPGHPEPYFADAIRSLDTTQKLTDHPCRAYLEPLFRPGAQPGNIGAAMLGYYLASEDKSVQATTVDAIAHLVAQGTLEAQPFAAHVGTFLRCGPLPAGRWTRCFAELAPISAAQAGFVREVIAQLLTFTPDEAPRDIGGMVELLYELHIAAGTSLKESAALDCLAATRAGGKLGKYAKKLVAMSVG